MFVILDEHEMTNDHRAHFKKDTVLIIVETDKLIETYFNSIDEIKLKYPRQLIAVVQ